MPLWLYGVVLMLVAIASLGVGACLLWASARVWSVRSVSFGHAILIEAIILPIGLGAAAASLEGSPALFGILGLCIPVVMIVLVRHWGRVRWWRAIGIGVTSLVLASVVFRAQAWALRSTIADSYVPEGSSMAPTIQPGDRFVADRTLSPRRWDIVVYRSPVDRRVVFVSRLIGLPGETVEIIGGRVHIDGAPAPLPDPTWPLYEAPRLPGDERPRGVEGSPITLGEDEFFFVGDNSAQAMDSRSTPAVAGHQPGAVPRGDLIGVARMFYYPLPRARLVR